MGFGKCGGLLWFPNERYLVHKKQLVALLPKLQNGCKFFLSSNSWPAGESGLEAVKVHRFDVVIESFSFYLMPKK